MSILNKIFGDYHKKYLKKLTPVVEEINSFEDKFSLLKNEELKEKTFEFKNKLKKGESLDDILPQAFALVREAAKRTLKQRHFDVQLIGGIVLHRGQIAEMKTGEGKTLTATLPLYLNALQEKGCHLVTVNDYLAKRDTVWMGQIYNILGLKVGCVVHNASYVYDVGSRKNEEEAKNSGTDTKDHERGNNNEKLDLIRDTVGGFKVVENYLRLVPRKEAYDADITYGTNNEFGFDYLRDNMVYDLDQQVQRGFHYAIVDEVDSILIDEARTPLIISAPDTESSSWYQDFARLIPRLDPKTDYEIDEKVRAVTLTENGIRKVENFLGLENIYEEKGIKYLHYLEQALRAEALFKKDRDYVVKEGQVIIVDEFTGRLMPGRRWSGGLHQAIEAKEGVKIQPESLTLASITFQNYFRMYKKLAGMTGTASTSAEELYKVYGLEVISVPTNKPMIRKDFPDRVYRTSAGKFKAIVEEVKGRYEKGQPVLVGTTSIEKNEYLSRLLTREGIPHQVLNAKHHEKEGEIIAQAGRFGAVTIATNMAGRGVDIILGGNPPNAEEARKVVEVGGLHVIGTERHEARRIDNQLRGRAGRQGDPGSSQFFLSLEDDLLRIFGGDRIKSLMSILKIPEDMPIENNLVSKAVEEAQSRIEGFNFDLRKHLLEYDDVLNKHRDTIYRKRKSFLETNDFRSEIEKWLKNGEDKINLDKKAKEFGSDFNKIARFIALRTLDMLWMHHLEEMEALRDSVRLRAYGQRDPLVEYKTEGHRMFNNLIKLIETNVIQTLLRISVVKHNNFHNPSRPEKIEENLRNKIGRNDPCPCGSGKKYKKCHGR